MTETIPSNQDLEKLRDCLRTVNYLKQAKSFDLITDEDYQKYIKLLNEKTHTIIDSLINSIVGV
ncbi:unnamed protein product [marine sediment metagenome]|uniref:Uncharacterized protein n=1 Tax=marine sediment metagenome TaxID=412755 RepID=X1V8P7_9ZZZZ